MVGADRRKVLDRLPYIGLDIESSEREFVRVEYSPNRPDFGTDYGISRALRGLMGKEVGLPTYSASPSGITVSVDPRLSSVRPYISCATAFGLSLDDEDVRQLISLQEDLHNGLGRRRKKAAIGLHDMDPLTPPIKYSAVLSSFKFRPLESGKAMKIEEILAKTEQGRLYGGILSRTRLFPIIVDSRDVVLSFPPVVNGTATKLSAKTRKIFVDVTGTESRTVDDVLAILVTTLSDMGAKIGSVFVKNKNGGRNTPDLSVAQVRLDLALVRRVTGLDLTRKQVIGCLRRSRLDVRGGRVLVPRYRIDILHPVDIAEEVALGYGIDKISALYPASKQPGMFNPFDEFLDKASDIMAGSGMVEMMTYELTDEKLLYDSFGRPSGDKIGVENPKSAEHSILRDSLVPSLLAALARNVKEEYPQRLFEIGRVYTKSKQGVDESWHLGCLLAHSQVSYTEAKMHLDSFVRLMTAREPETRQTHHWAFAEGRSASVLLGGVDLGFVGEVGPEALHAFGLNLPVAGFEIDLSLMHKQLK